MLRRLERELRKPTCPINREPETYEEELEVLVTGCRKNLNVLDQVLTKYNALSEQERSGRRLWQKIRFGNGKMTDMANLRAKLMYHTSAMSLFINMVSLGTIGRVEQQLNDAGGDLKEIKFSVNGIVAQLISQSKVHEGSTLTAYAHDERAVWKEFRRELIQDGLSSSVIKEHKKLIRDYIEELGSRGLLDDRNADDESEKEVLESDTFADSTLSHDLEIQRGADKDGITENEIDRQDLKSGPVVDSDLSIDLEIYRSSEINDEATEDEVEEQDFESHRIYDGIHRGSEGPSGVLVEAESLTKPEGLYESSPMLFVNRSKTIARSRVWSSPILICFSIERPWTRSNANLSSVETFPEGFADKFITDLRNLTLLRMLRLRHLFVRKELRFSSLYRIKVDHETLDAFVFEDFKFATVVAKHKAQKPQHVYIAVYESLEGLHDMLNHTINKVSVGQHYLDKPAEQNRFWWLAISNMWSP